MDFDYQGFFKKNRAIKLFSAFIGIAIWFWVNMTSERGISSSLTCQVRFYNAHPSVHVTSENRDVVLSLSGRRIDIVANLDKVVAFVDVSKAGSPPCKVDLPVEIFVPGKLKVVAIEPEEISVSVSRVSTSTKKADS